MPLPFLIMDQVTAPAASGGSGGKTVTPVTGGAGGEKKGFWGSC